MSDFKEVWRLTGGTKKEIDGASRYKLSNSWTIDAGDRMVKSIMDERFSTMIIAYTLGQKRRRVVCDSCGGLGRLFPLKNQNTLADCESCNGTGKTWEYSE